MAVEVMNEVGIDLTDHTPKHVDRYAEQKWDYVITVCGDADANCPTFAGEVKNRLHIGFEDPSTAVGTSDFVAREFHRVRDEIKARFYEFYLNELKPRLD